jgi:hypothetical protein
MSMSRKLAIGGLCVAAVALLGYSRAQAEEYLGPPPSGMAVSFQNKFVVCDTKEQVVELGKLGASEYAPMLAKLNELYEKADDRGEHTCVVAPIENIIAGENEEIGFIVDSKGVKSKAWALHIGNEHGEWWMLYAVHPKAVQGSSI